jgi:hypothetical protein
VQLAAAVDDIERYFARGGAARPHGSTVVSSVAATARRVAKREVGEDGRLSKADVLAGFPSYLRDDFLALRSEAAAPPPVKPAPTRPVTPKPVVSEPTPVTPVTPIEEPAVGDRPYTPPSANRTLSMLNIPLVLDAAQLLKELLTKMDNGDETLTASEAIRAMRGDVVFTPVPEEPHFDNVTFEAVRAAIDKMKAQSVRSLSGLHDGIDRAMAEITLAATTNSNLDYAVNKKVKTTLAKTLLNFAAAHSGHRAEEFHFMPGTDPVFVPTKPFVPKASDSPAELVESLMGHFNSYSNDNSTHGRRPASITRYVLGTVETTGIAKAIAALPAARARQVVAALARRIHMADDRSSGWMPRRIWVEPKAESTLDRLARDLEVSADFKGVPKAPGFDYY